MIFGDFNPFPRRQRCEWIEQGDGLEARLCDDGAVMMWKDDEGNVWLPHERPPSKWRRYFRKHHFSGALGAAPALMTSTEPGGCPAHPSHKPTPLAKVRRLQNALRGLSKRTKDRSISVVADGLVGPHTVSATNRALAAYAPGFGSGGFTRSQVIRLSPQIAAWLEKAPYTSTTAPTSPAPFVASAPPVVQQSVPAPAPGGAETMPYPPQGYAPGYYQQPAGYYPQQGYYPPRGPGGLPTDRASVDVKAFIPAQYEHVRLNPGTGMAVLVVGLVVVAMLARDKKHKKGD